MIKELNKNKMKEFIYKVQAKSTKEDTDARTIICFKREELLDEEEIKIYLKKKKLELVKYNVQ